MQVGMQGCSRMKRIGIMGGLGSETSAKFCVQVNKFVRSVTGVQPSLHLENVPMSVQQELALIRGDHAGSFPVLKDALVRLNKTDVDVIVIPCNSVHIFIDELRRLSKVPVMSITEEVARACRCAGFRNVGILATSTSIRQCLHSDELQHVGIKSVIPSGQEQGRVNQVIKNILDGCASAADVSTLISIVHSLQKKGAEAVILGCTDFQNILSQKDVAVPLVDTLKVLEEKTIALILEDSSVC
ncbi:MAG: amino acid racemase [Nanoarchaeota archaeon]|nr:amino acid racemase [Nanoarchaeota archaeon]